MAGNDKEGGLVVYKNDALATVKKGNNGAKSEVNNYDVSSWVGVKEDMKAMTASSRRRR